MIGPIINDYYFYPDYVEENDTITATQLPQIVADCSNCLLSLGLSGTHNSPFVYKAGSTINSKAYVNANVSYQAGDRVRLETGFKTNQAIQFGVVMEGYD